MELNSIQIYDRGLALRHRIYPPEAWAYSTMMSRIVCTFFVEAIAACVIAYGRQDNEDLSSIRRVLAKGVHELSKSAGIPKVK